MRIDGRGAGDLRPVRIVRGVNKYAEGSALVTFGDTKVLCTASVKNRVPAFLRGKGTGWITAEYALLPRSTAERNPREAARGRQTGRTHEIQRLIGRSLRAAVDMKALGENAIVLDCDVLQADGGTRTAAITGAYVALVEAVAGLWNGRGPFPVRDFLAAVSVGRSGEELLLDLCYEEDSAAAVDMNVVMLGDGRFVEVQGTGEEASFSRAEMNELLDMAEGGIRSLHEVQREALGELADLVGSVGQPVVLLATHNEGKVREFQAALAEAGYLGVPVAEVATLEEPEEDGETFADNALIKAEYYMKATGMPALADDSGIEVDALHGEPGVYSARYAGVHGDDEANNRKLIANLAKVPLAERTARYVCELVLAFPEGEVIRARGICEGLIQDEAKGTGGFGYDPYFYLPERDCTMAELSLADKNAISHRGRALRKLIEKLQEE